jgi:hypothetical protein
MVLVPGKKRSAIRVPHIAEAKFVHSVWLGKQADDVHHAAPVLFRVI